MNSRQQKYYAEFANIAQSRGGKLLSRGYVNSDTHLLFECKCGHQWCGRPDHIKRGSWCPRCGGSDSKSAEQKFREVVASKGGKVIGRYKNNKIKIEIECNMGHRWHSNSDHIIRDNSWCPTCDGYDGIIPAKIFYKTISDKGGQALGIYIKDNTHVPVKCGYNHIWMVTPNHIKSGSWCPVCKESRGEHQVSLTLSNYKIPYTRQYQHPLIPKFKYDFCFVYNNITYLLEYDGIQHFEYGYFHKSEEDFKYKQNIDRMKSYVAIQTGYRLIRIDYTKINDILNVFAQAINSNSIFYVSSPLLYDWIYIPFPFELLQRHNCVC